MKTATRATTANGSVPHGITRRRVAGVAAGAAWLAGCGAVGDEAGRGAPAVGCRSPLEYFSPWRADQSVHPDLLKALAAVKPTCSIEITQVPSAELQAKLTTAVAGGTPPALVNIPPGWTKQVVAGGLIAPVDDFFKRDKIVKDDFPRGMWEQMSYQNRVWFMPAQEANADFVLFWNKAHFREVGLDPEKGPQTTAELDTMLQRLTRERGGAYDRVGMIPWDLYGHGNTFQAWGRAFGATIYDATKDELTFNDSPVQQAVEWYTGWAKRLDAARVVAFRTAVTTQGVHWFGSGRFSIQPLVAINLATVRRNDPTLEIGAGVMPGGPQGKPGTVSVGGWVISAVPGPKREEAWDFMRFYGASPEGTGAVAANGSIPGWLKSPGLAELAQDPLFKAYVDGLRRAEFPQLSFYMPNGWDANPIQEIIDGQRGVREVLEQINAEANRRHAEWKARNPR